MPYLDEEGLGVLAEEIQGLSDERFLSTLNMIYGDDVVGVVPIGELPEAMFQPSLLTIDNPEGDDTCAGHVAPGVLLFKGQLFVNHSIFGVNLTCDHTLSCKYYILAVYSEQTGWSLEVRAGEPVNRTWSIPAPEYDETFECPLFSITHLKGSTFQGSERITPLLDLDVYQEIADLATTVDTKADSEQILSLLALLYGPNASGIVPIDDTITGQFTAEVTDIIYYPPVTDEDVYSPGRRQFNISVNPGYYLLHNHILHISPGISSSLSVSENNVTTGYIVAVRTVTNGTVKWSLRLVNSTPTPSDTTILLWKIRAVGSTGEYTLEKVSTTLPGNFAEYAALVGTKLSKSYLVDATISKYGRDTVGILPIGSISEGRCNINVDITESTPKVYNITVYPGFFFIDNNVVEIKNSLQMQIEAASTTQTIFLYVTKVTDDEWEWQYVNYPSQAWPTNSTTLQIVWQVTVSNTATASPRRHANVLEPAVVSTTLNGGNSTIKMIKNPDSKCRTIVISGHTLESLTVNYVSIDWIKDPADRPIEQIYFLGYAHPTGSTSTQSVIRGFIIPGGNIYVQTLSGSISNAQVFATITYVASSVAS